MAEENDKVGMNIDVKVENNLQKTSKDVQKLDSDFKSLLSTVDKVTENVQKLKGLKLSPDVISALDMQSNMRVTPKGTVNFKYNSFSNADNRRANKLANKELELLDKQIDLQEANVRIAEEKKKLGEENVAKSRIKNSILQKDNENYERLLKAQENRSYGSMVRADASYKEATTKTETGYWNEQARRLRYRNDHPEMFMPRYMSKEYQLGRGINQIGMGLKSEGVPGRILGDLLETVGSALINPIMGFATAIKNGVNAVKDFSKAAIAASIEIESIKTNLGIVYGSKTQANQAFGELSQYAVKSPFGIQETTEMAILLKQSGVYASELMDTLRMIGDTAGGNAEKMKRIANNYAQIVSIGKASMLDMRQFAYAGIPIFKAVSKELGVTQSQLRKLISDGKVTGDIIQKVFQDLTGVNGVFENATERGAKTMKARLQNLKDAKQLAMAGFGQYMLNAGERTGGDSIAQGIVSAIENMFQGMNEWSTLKNIEHDVHLIETRNSEISKIQNLIDYNKALGNKDVVKVLEERLGQLSTIASPDDNRATLYQLYKFNTEDYEALDKRYQTGDKDSAIKEAENELYEADKRLNEFTQSYIDENRAFIALSEEDYKKYEAQLGALTLASYTAANKIDKVKDAFEKLNNVTEEQIKAYRETLMIQSRQLGKDYLSKKADSSSSVINVVSEMKEEWAKTPAGKAQEEAEKKQRWEDTRAILLSIDKHIDSNGLFNLASLKPKEILSMIDTGAFVESEEIKPENGMSEEDKDFVKKQYDVLSKAIYTDYISQGKAEDDKKRKLKSLNLTANKLLSDNKNFYTNLIKLQGVQNLLLAGLPDEMKAKYTAILGMAMLKLEPPDTSVLNLDFSQEATSRKSEEVEQYALWKRILSETLGINIAAFKNSGFGTDDAINFYHNNLAKRKTVGNTLTSGLTSGTMTMTQLRFLTGYRAGNEPATPNDKDDYTLPIAWKETGDAVRDFANTVNSSTDTIEAWMNSVKEEYQTLTKLVGGGILSYETELDSKSSVQTNWDLSQFQILSDDFNKNSQGLNAFGEEIYDELGNLIIGYIQKGTGENAKWKSGIVLNDEKYKSYKTNTQYIEGIENVKDISDKNYHKTVAQALDDFKSNFSLSSDDYKVLKALGIIEEKSTEELGKIQVNGRVYRDSLDKLVINTDELAQGSRTLLSNSYLAGIRKDLTEAVVKEKVLSSANYDNEFVLSMLNTNPDKFQSSIDAFILKKLAKFDEYRSFSTSQYSHGDTLTKPDGFETQDEFDAALAEANKYSNITTMDDVWNTILTASKDSEEYALAIDLLNESLEYLGFTAEEDADALKMIADYQDAEAKLPEIKAKNSFNELFGSSVDMKGDQNDFEYLLGKAKNKPYRSRVNLLTEAGMSAEDAKNFNWDTAFKDDKGNDLDESVKKASMDKLELKASENILSDMFDDLTDISLLTGKKAFTAPFEYLGECLVQGADATESLGSRMHKVLAGTMQQIGPAMTEAGFRMIAAGAAADDINWGMIAAGMGMVAAGGIASGVGTAWSNTNNQKDKSDDQIKKTEDLKDQLADLLEQARSDALYYEHNLRHKTALGINKGFSYQSVNDAIITPGGDVISTHPDDYLIATKTPQQFGTPNMTVQPVINFVVENNAGSDIQVRQEKKMNNDGSIQVTAIIESVVGDYIASSRSDEAFNARDARAYGNRSVM